MLDKASAQTSRGVKAFAKVVPEVLPLGRIATLPGMRLVTGSAVVEIDQSVDSIWVARVIAAIGAQG